MIRVEIFAPYSGGKTALASILRRELAKIGFTVDVQDDGVIANEPSAASPGAALTALAARLGDKAKVVIVTKYVSEPPRTGRPAPVVQVPPVGPAAGTVMADPEFYAPDEGVDHPVVAHEKRKARLRELLAGPMAYEAKLLLAAICNVERPTPVSLHEVLVRRLRYFPGRDVAQVEELVASVLGDLVGRATCGGPGDGPYVIHPDMRQIAWEIIPTRMHKEMQECNPPAVA